MKNTFILAGSISGAVAVMLGAFAAHGLKSVLSEENLRVFHTGVEYQFYHTFALLITGLLIDKIKTSLATTAGYLFLAGIILFSGSLYLLTTVPSLHWMGFVTPLGGLCFIGGWILLGVSFFRHV